MSEDMCSIGDYDLFRSLRTFDDRPQLIAERTKQMQKYVSDHGKPEWVSDTRRIKTLLHLVSFGLNVVELRRGNNRFADPAKDSVNILQTTSDKKNTSLNVALPMISASLANAGYLDIAKKGANPKTVILAVSLQKLAAISGILPINQCGAAIAGLGITGLSAIALTPTGVGAITMGLAAAVDALNVYDQCIARR